MGMDRQIRFEHGQSPAWEQIAALLSENDYPVEMRMIDGELAFPDERPSDSWTELRIGTPHGMITLRRVEGGVSVVTWGNADQEMIQAWNALTWAVAKAANGRIENDEESKSPGEFRSQSDLPPSFSEAGPTAD